MKTHTLMMGISLILVPIALQGQTRASAATDARASGQLSQAGGETALAATARMELPMAPVESVIAEGRARGATAADIDRAALAVHGRLNASRTALSDESRPTPTDAEIEAGASALAAGAHAADLVTIRDAAPAHRSVAVSLSALAEMRSRGMQSGAAAAEIATLLSAGVNDSDIIASGTALGARLESTATSRIDGNASGSLGGGLGVLDTAVGVAGSVGARILP